MDRNPQLEIADQLTQEKVEPGEVPSVKYGCPRWDDITQYLFDNRAPGELSLDTMTILSVPLFYRYIRNHGGIDLTPMEFRNFLGVANERKELFMQVTSPYSQPSYHVAVKLTRITKQMGTTSRSWHRDENRS